MRWRTDGRTDHFRPANLLIKVSGWLTKMALSNYYVLMTAVFIIKQGWNVPLFNTVWATLWWHFRPFIIHFGIVEVVSALYITNWDPKMRNSIPIAVVGCASSVRYWLWRGTANHCFLWDVITDPCHHFKVQPWMCNCIPLFLWL